MIHLFLFVKRVNGTVVCINFLNDSCISGGVRSRPSDYDSDVVAIYCWIPFGVTFLYKSITQLEIEGVQILSPKSTYQSL